MDLLLTNEQEMKYSLQMKERIPIYETDDDGNVIYKSYEDDEGNLINILDDDGNKIPETTGDYEYKYSTPVSFCANISMGCSDTQAEIFGIDPSGYDATIVTERNALPLTETSVIWFQSEPTYKDEDEAIPNPKSADYQVVKVVDSLNYTTIVLRKRTK